MLLLGAPSFVLVSALACHIVWLGCTAFPPQATSGLAAMLFRQSSGVEDVQSKTDETQPRRKRETERPGQLPAGTT